MFSFKEKVLWRQSSSVLSSSSRGQSVNLSVNHVNLPDFRFGFDLSRWVIAKYTSLRCGGNCLSSTPSEWRMHFVTEGLGYIMSRHNQRQYAITKLPHSKSIIAINIDGAIHLATLQSPWEPIMATDTSKDMTKDNGLSDDLPLFWTSLNQTSPYITVSSV